MHIGSERYRPDIDGLRAVAVLAVVVYHAFPHLLPGGFVGVDIFFVISGFLISGQLIAAAASGSFSFSEFYARRIRRIFPALLVVLVSVAIAGWWLLLPDEWEELRGHIGASAAFAGNFLSWSQAGYFDRPSELKPLLHLWSLGVEEQFYLVWPLMIWWWWKSGWRWTTTIAVAAAVSFAANVVVVQQGGADAAFFLPHTRLWQLAVGAVLAAHLRERARPVSPPLTHAVSLAGLTLLILSCVVLSRGTGSGSYPGWAALLPTAAAAFVIAAGADACVNRSLLSGPVMVSIGLVSYPLYLWHWPILSFLQITEQGDVSPKMKAAAIAAALLLAALTYLVIERPVRRRLTPVSLRRLQPLLAAMGAVGVSMVLAIETDWLTPPVRTAQELEVAVRNDLNSGLCRKRFPGLGEYCQLFDPYLTVTTALLGDSHAGHFMPGLGAMLRKSKFETLVHLGQSGCPPLLGIERQDQVGDNTCTRVNGAVIDAVVADKAISTVWLSFRGAAATTGTTRDGPDLFRATSSDAMREAAIRQGLRMTIPVLQRAGKRVGVLLQVPELDFRVDECIGRPFSLAHGPARVPCSVPREAVMARQASYRTMVFDMQREFGIEVYDPISTLCDLVACHATAEGRLLYHDDNHLGVFGSFWALRALNLSAAN